jgi:GTP cyclohydrolase IB
MKLDAQHQKSTLQAADTLPDISLAEKTQFVGTLSQVGMGKIEMPVLFSATGGTPMMIPALVDAYVSLDSPEAKGIHMSRLYLELKNNLTVKPLNFETLKSVLENFIESHSGLSESSYISLKFNVPLERKALISGEVGYRQYPVVFDAKLKNNKFDLSFSAEIMYSSTCPCSAALARQLNQQEFAMQFDKQDTIKKADVLKWLGDAKSTAALPHAQRSLARVQIRLHENKNMSLVELIDLSEKALGTPVQAAVKRADEQEFARLNAQNLMFCEDAARKLRGALESDSRVLDYHIHVEHQESLHPHDAISRVVKGIPGGFRC